MSAIKQQEQEQAKQQITTYPIKLDTYGQLIYDMENLDQPTKYEIEELVNNPYILEQFPKEFPMKKNGSHKAHQDIEHMDGEALGKQIPKQQVVNLKNNFISQSPNINQKNQQQIKQSHNSPKHNSPQKEEEIKPRQIEGQKFKTLELQKQQEVQYYVYEDLANFTKAFTDTIETLKHFQDLENQEYVNVALNRLILQTNVSNAVHFDCQETFARNPDQQQLYLQEKKNAQQIFDQLMSQACLVKNEKVQQCLQNYVQNFQEKTNLNQLGLLRIEKKADFNQKTAQTLFDGMRNVDNTLAQVNQGKYKKLGKQDISIMLEERKIFAQNQLNQNFPKNEKTMKKASELNKNTDFL